MLRSKTKPSWLLLYICSTFDFREESQFGMWECHYLFILSEPCQGGEEICKTTSFCGVILHIGYCLFLETCFVFWDFLLFFFFFPAFTTHTLTVLILNFVSFFTAGRYLLMRKANWRRETYQTPWSLRHTTVSYRQTRQRAKYDGPTGKRKKKKKIPSLSLRRPVTLYSSSDRKSFYF